MEKKSIWTDGMNEKVCPKLDKDISVDVLIIGGGITGISTAYHLINSGLKVCLVDRNKTCSGVTSRTTGKLTYLQDNIYSKLKSYHGESMSKLYLESQKDAIMRVKDTIKKNKIDCNFEKVKSFVFSNSRDTDMNEEIDLLKGFDVPIKECDLLPNKDKVLQAYYVSDTYVFHPLKYLFALKEMCLKENILIYENTKIVSICKENDIFMCKTSRNKITAKYVVLALHYPYFLVAFLFPLKSYIEKSYIGAFKTDKNYKFSSVSVSKPIISSRYYSDNDDVFEFYLTNSHNTCVYDNDKSNFDDLICSKSKETDYLWSNNDIMTCDSLPFIGFTDDNLLIGTGYNTWGMTNGFLAGWIISDLILGKNNKYSSLFNPLRGINFGKVINFPTILCSSAFSFTKSKLCKNKSWYSSNVKFEKRDGKEVAIYIDENKKEHIVYNKCPHLKCSLIFNEVEKTWDCPCHGSRFDLDGKCIEGPSNYDISY
ncbi:MAG: FAD-dependent oxidoreductase, partial [Bacilli bacterium]